MRFLVMEVKRTTTTRYRIDDSLVEMMRYAEGQAGSKIAAVKLMRRATDLGLARCKAMVEVLMIGESDTPSYTGRIVEHDNKGVIIELTAQDETDVPAPNPTESDQ